MPNEPLAAEDDGVDWGIADAWLTQQRAERLAILLISLTAILTAWTTFQSAKWNGEQTTALASASQARAESESHYNDSREEYIVDVTMFNAWLEATVTEQFAVARAYQDRFPPTLTAAFAPWIATDPLQNPAAPKTPFEEYDYENEEEGDEFYAAAQRHGADALTHNQRSDNYTAMTIVFATVILFAALSDKIPGARSRWIMLIIATVGMLIGVGFLATFPVVV